jgi:prolipoprotein diacylglyceryltransferase
LASGAASRPERRLASGGSAGRAATCGCSWTRPPRRCSSPRPSAASATTSTRNCSAGRPACPGDCRSRRFTGYAHFSTFQPTFLYELIFDLLLAAALVWLGHHRGIRPPGLFALYVAGYSAFRLFEESLRIDSSEHFLGLRLNFYIAAILAVTGITWFIRSQRRGGAGPPPEPASPVPTNAAET